MERKGKWLRFVVWLLSLAAAAGFWTIWQGAFAARYLADGSAMARHVVGQAGFWIAVVIFGWNMLWGMVGWLIMMIQQKWGPVKVVLASLWAVAWRGVVYLVVFLVSSVLVAGMLDGLFKRSEVGEVSAWKRSEAQMEELLARDDWTVEEAKQVLREELLMGMDFAEDASGNARGGGGWWTQDVYAETSVKTLNRFTISSGRNFVIWWTDEGEDRISEAAAVRLAEKMEYIARRYKQVFGFDFDVETVRYYDTWVPFGESMMEKQKRLLGEDAGLTDSAMAVYVINPYDGDNATLGSYLGLEKAELGQRLTISILAPLVGEAETARLYGSIPRLPAINVNPGEIENESFALIMAHEMGHHYQSVYCGGKCASGEFISETLPSWTASLVIEEQPRRYEDNLLARHHASYIRDLGSCRIDKIGIGKGCGVNVPGEGYPTFGFLYHYAEQVAGGRGKIWAAMQARPALEKLMGEATADERYRTFGSLAEGNLTNDYGGNYTLHAKTWPGGEPLPCDVMCEQRYELGGTRMSYFYFSSGGAEGRKVEVAGEGVGVSVLKLDRSVGSWRVAERNKAWGQVEVAPDEEVAVVVYNYGLDDAEFVMRMSDAELEEIMEEEWVGGWSFSDGCIRFRLEDMFAVVRSIYEVVETVTGREGEFTGEWDKMVADARGNMPFEWMTVCEYPVRAEASMSEVQGAMRRIVGSPSIGLNVQGVEVRAAYDVATRRTRSAFYYNLPMDGGRVIIMIATE